MIVYFFSIIFILYIITLPGQVFFNLAKVEPSIKTSLLHSFFLGLIIYTVTTGYLSIILPINYTTALACIAIITTASFVINRMFYDTSSQIFKLLKQKSTLSLSLLIIIALLSSTGIRNYDSGLYHVQAIQWINAYPVVPGLGNLHGRFAFNSMFFPVSALFSITGDIWGHRLLIYPLNATAMFVFLKWQITNINIFFKEKTWKSTAMAIAITFLTIIYFAKWVSSPTPDLICTLFIIIVLQMIFLHQESIYYSRFFLAGLVFLGISFKLSTLFFGLVVLIYLIDKNKILKDLFLFASIFLVTITPFLIRNYFLSGYLIYPFPQLDWFDVDWKIPLGEVYAMKNSITAWSRMPGLNAETVLTLPIWEWLPVWFAEKDMLMKLILLTLLLPIFIWVLFTKCRQTNFSKFIVLLITNVLLWANAPDPRFFYGFLFFNFGYVLFLTIQILENRVNDILFRKLIGVLVICFSIPTSYVVAKILYSHTKSPQQVVLPSMFSRETHIPGFETIIGNFIYYKPTTGDQCFYQDIPCTNQLLPSTLKLRGPVPADGFMHQSPK